MTIEAVHPHPDVSRPTVAVARTSRSVNRDRISIYEIQSFLGLINSTSGLILPYVTLNLAISVLIMRSMFQLVPHELIEAARIDGAGHWRTLWMVGLPMVRNGLVVVFIVNFVTAWGEFLLCPTLTNDQAARTMPVALAGAQGG